MRWFYAACLITTFAFTSAANASAAVPNLVLLAGQTGSIVITGGGGKADIETVGKVAVTCRKDKVELESPEAGGEHKIGVSLQVFEECEAIGQKCKTPFAPVGDLILGTFLWELVFDSLSPLSVAFLITVPETLIECGPLIRLKIRGTTLLLITPMETAGTSFELPLSQKLGKPTDDHYWVSGNGTELTPQLLLSSGGGPFEEAAIGSETYKVTASKNMRVSG